MTCTSLIGLAAAIVVQDWTALRAAPDEHAARQATLWRGDWVEVRTIGARRDYLKVYHHRSERPGYVRRQRLRRYRLGAADAPRLRAVVDFLRDTPGAESLGIGYVALYLRAAPGAAALAPGVFDALGVMATRLARRASRATGERGRRFIAAHLDVAKSYGVRFSRFEAVGASRSTGSTLRTCYAGDAFRRVLALGKRASPEQAARATLGLTDPACVAPGLRPHEQRAWLAKHVALLGRPDPTRSPAYLGNRLRLRLALLAGRLAYALARSGDGEAAARAAKRAHDALLRVRRSELTRSDRPLLRRARLQVAAVRWAHDAARPLKKGPRLVIEASDMGQRCVWLVDGKGRRQVKRCTYGQVWPGSIQRSPRRRQLAVAVQQLPGWLVVWLYRRTTTGWQVQTLAPSVEGTPELGYVEVAGWTPGGKRLLLVREALVEGKPSRRFESLVASSLRVVVSTGSLRRFRSFRRWHSAGWKRATLALR